MTTTEPTQSEKFLWLGLSRNLEDVDEDDIPNDTLGLSNLNVEQNTMDPIVFKSSATVEAQNKLSERVTETFSLTVDGEQRQTKTVTLEGDESKTVEMEFRFEEYGYKTVRITAGEESVEVQEFVSAFG